MGSMTVVFIGISRRSGVGKTSGNPYDMCQMVHAVPMQDKKTDKYTFKALGCRAVELDCDPACMDQFADCETGSEIDVLLEPDPRDARYNRVVGLA